VPHTLTEEWARRVGEAIGEKWSHYRNVFIDPPDGWELVTLGFEEGSYRVCPACLERVVEAVRAVLENRQ